MSIYSHSKRYVILFDSIHSVIKSEKLIKLMRVDYQIVPVPSNLSTECGMCIEISEISLESIQTMLIKNCIRFKIYHI
jgi:hypothetical protein